MGELAPLGTGANRVLRWGVVSRIYQVTGTPGRPANHVPKTLQDRMCWACRAGNVGTRSYGGAMPIGMVTYALMRAYYAINGAAPLPRQGSRGHGGPMEARGPDIFLIQSIW